MIEREKKENAERQRYTVRGKKRKRNAVRGEKTERKRVQRERDRERGEKKNAVKIMVFCQGS